MDKAKKIKTHDLKWKIAIKEVKHREGEYPVFEWIYGLDETVGFIVQAWPQGYLCFKESRECEGEAFKTGNVEELLVWMKQVKNWTEEPPRIREVFGTILETRIQFGKIEPASTKDFFALLWEKLRSFCPWA